ncbi:hypothetical protein ACFW2V_12910 [Streptomyces sp. NPDC058947]|uniref:hypothetical protein n=1 Tax=Streptomyces sp. NPDC058947 TaxID=3346675 RepID=UPI0036812360
MVVGLSLAAVALVGSTAALTAVIVKDDGKGASSAPSEAASALADPVDDVTEEPEETEEAESEYYNESPSASDFELSLKTTRKACFGSAGCNVTVEPELTYNAAFPPEPDVTVSLTYEVRGGNDGPTIETIELTADGDSLNYSSPSTLVRTASGSVKVTAKITDVSTY